MNTINKLIVILLSFFCLNSYSQEIAVTESGDSIIVYSDGTWEFYSVAFNIEENNSEDSISFNKEEFNKGKSSKTKILGKNDYYMVYIDNEDWKRIPPGQINPDADLAFQYLKGDVYSIVIYEEMEIGLEYLVNIAYNNAQSFANDIEIVNEEFRIVNGDTVICMQMNGTAQGMGFTYYSYYTSGVYGSIQFHTWTGSNIFSKYKEEVEKILNGLVINEEAIKELD